MTYSEAPPSRLVLARDGQTGSTAVGPVRSRLCQEKVLRPWPMKRAIKAGVCLFLHSPGLKPSPFRRIALACFAF